MMTILKREIAYWSSYIFSKIRLLIPEISLMPVLLILVIEFRYIFQRSKEETGY